MVLLHCPRNPRNVAVAYAENYYGGSSFSGRWWSFVFGVRCLWRHNLMSYSCFQAKLVDTIGIFFYTHSPYFCKKPSPIHSPHNNVFVKYQAQGGVTNQPPLRTPLKRCLVSIFCAVNRLLHSLLNCAFRVDGGKLRNSCHRSSAHITKLCWALKLASKAWWSKQCYLPNMNFNLRCSTRIFAD